MKTADQQTNLQKGCFKLEPIVVGKPWGGDHLKDFQTKTCKLNVGEVVLLSALADFPSKIEYNNESILFINFWQNIAFPKLIANNSKYSNLEDFPFMLKLISTDEPLSIQVHPSNTDVKRLGLSGFGKAEAWFILESDSQAKAYFGLKVASTYEEFLSSSDENKLNFLTTLNPHKNNIYFLQPGLIHGTQGKLLFFEIQQSSNYTFRLYDFGRGRKLSLEQAAKVVKLQAKTKATSYGAGVNIENFHLDILGCEKLQVYELNSDQAPFQIVSFFTNSGYITGDNFHYDVKWGDSFFIWGLDFVKESISFKSTKSSQKNDFIVFASPNL